MSRCKHSSEIEICEHCFEERCTSSYLLGIAVGYEDGDKTFRQLAGEAYANGLDDRAKCFRDVAVMLGVKGAKARENPKQHDRENPWEVT